MLRAINLSNTSILLRKRSSSFPIARFVSSSAEYFQNMNNKKASDNDHLLLATTDPFAHISSSFHPAVVRAFKNSRVVANPSNQYLELLQKTEKTVLLLNDQISTRNISPSQASQFMPRFESARYLLKDYLHRVVKFTQRDEEVMGYTALMVIFQPRNFEIWEDFDKQIANRLATKTDYNMELALLASYALKNYCLNSKVSNHVFLTPKKVFHDLIRHRVKMKNLSKTRPKNRSATSSSSSSSSSSPTSSSNNNNYDSSMIKNTFDYLLSFPREDLFISLGTNHLVDSKKLEILSLQFHLFNFIKFAPPNAYDLPHSTDDDIPKLQSLGDELTQHAMTVFNSIQNPIKLRSLQSIWEIIYCIHLPNSYFVYKKLFQLIYNSIVIDPMQIITDQEEMLISLYQSMITSGFKNVILIDKINELLLKYGFNYDKYGIRIMNLAIQLDSLNFAIQVLELMISKDSFNFNHLMSQSSKNSVFHLSFPSRNQLYKTMSVHYPAASSSWKKDKNNKITTDMKQSEDTGEMETPSTSSSSSVDEITGPLASSSSSSRSISKSKLANDLVLSMFCFHRESHNSPQYQLLTHVEHQLLQSYTQTESTGITVNDCLSLLKCYAFAGRKHPLLMNYLFNKLSTSYPSLTVQELGDIIYYCARLATTPTFLSDLIALYFQKLREMKNSSSSAKFYFNYRKLIRAFWSLSALELLNTELIAEFEPLIFTEYESFPKTIRRGSFHMLTQIYNEMRIVSSSNPPSTVTTTAPTNSRKISNAKKNGESLLSLLADNEKFDSFLNTVKTVKGIPFEEGDEGTEVSEMERIEISQEDKPTEIVENQKNNQNKKPVNKKPANEVVTRFKSFLDNHLRDSTLKNMRKHWQESTFSSHTHMEVSRALSEAGIQHECEKVILETSCIADIFIPFQESLPWARYFPKKQDIYLEVDGPTHFDSYLHVKQHNDFSFFLSFLSFLISFSFFYNIATTWTHEDEKTTV
jgi:hypothetical protein